MRAASLNRGLGRGKLIAALLAGAWRATPPGTTLSEEQLAGVLPGLLASRVGALAWWSIRRSSTGALPAAAHLRAAYRYAALQAAIYEADLCEVVAALQATGIPPLLAKGWSIARLYPEPGLRPCLDADLWVAPDQQVRARQTISSLKDVTLQVDLQSEIRYLDDRSLRDVRAHAQIAAVADVEVSVVGPEDHLRLIAMHLLSHGIRNPLWLCDVGAFMESLPAGFDWDYCLSGSRGCAEWIVCVLALAHQLLGARLGGAASPVDLGSYRLPRWLAPAVLRQWQRLGEQLPGATMSVYLRRPSLFLWAFRDRWADPIETTFHWRGAPNNLPRWPYQLGDCLGRAFWFAARAGLTRLRPGAYREPPVAWRRWRPGG